MNTRINELIDRVHHLEDELEQEVQRRREALHADFEQQRVRFEAEVLAQQRRLKMGMMKYMLDADLRNILSAPVIYAVIFPLLLLDMVVIIYQKLCFPLYGIAPVRRRDYLVFDRNHLAYLNLIEKINCAYCSYANGFAAYLKEVVGRTEQYWCPIKNARRVLHAHPYYNDFVDFGDAEAYRHELHRLRKDLGELGSKGEKED